MCFFLYFRLHAQESKARDDLIGQGQGLAKGASGGISADRESLKLVTVPELSADRALHLRPQDHRETAQAAGKSISCPCRGVTGFVFLILRAVINVLPLCFSH